LHAAYFGRQDASNPACMPWGMDTGFEVVLYQIIHENKFFVNSIVLIYKIWYNGLNLITKYIKT